MTNAITSKATSKAGRTHRAPAYVALLLGATALVASSLPASAANLQVDKEIKDWLNDHGTQRHYSIKSAGLQGSHWEITGVRLSRMRAPKVEVNRQKGGYKVIAIKGVAMCADDVNKKGDPGYDPDSSVMQQIKFIGTATDSHTIHASDTVTTGGSLEVSLGIKFGAGTLIEKEGKITAEVHHDKSHKSGNSSTSSTTQTISEQAQIRLDGVGGKWGVIWARQHKMKDIPYSAVFKPSPNDLVTFNLKRLGEACMFQHPGYSGGKRCFGAGASVPKLRNLGFNDEASSVRVTRGLQATFYENNNYKGKAWEVTGDHPRLHNWLDDGFSSIKVRGPETKVIQVPFRLIEPHLPVNLREFKLTGKISVDITAGNTSLLATVNMKPAELQEFCALTGGVGGAAGGPSSSPVPGGKKSKKTAAQMVKSLDMPATAATIKKLKLKAPRK